ncbi:MAG: hypothetical protein A2283_09990 [Lentisphaerae bacterium RIFOXYA12_FULL_48_11]|nr:MAG: hypothetical protein A2283_09990 [Lentisphaerae bacterium RIFOXYA12_FULL_48_11]
MGVIIDTSIWIDIERGTLKPVDVAERIHNDAVFLTPTILAELQYGVERASTPAKRNLRLSAITRLQRKPCLMINNDTGIIFGRIAAGLDNKGKPSNCRIHDLWIAASTIQHGFQLLTQNTSDFEDIAGLKLIAM